MRVLSSLNRNNQDFCIVNAALCNRFNRYRMRAAHLEQLDLDTVDSADYSSGIFDWCQSKNIQNKVSALTKYPDSYLNPFQKEVV